jgi:hypothetical protein
MADPDNGSPAGHWRTLMQGPLRDPLLPVTSTQAAIETQLPDGQTNTSTWSSSRQGLGLGLGRGGSQVGPVREVRVGVGM